MTYSQLSSIWSCAVFKKRLFYFLLGLIGIIAFQRMCWEGKVVEVTPKSYEMACAVDLKLTPKMRYGYAQSWHGAFLLKTEKCDSLVLTPDEQEDESNALHRNETENDPEHTSDLVFEFPLN
jgi:hypothetical protein